MFIGNSYIHNLIKYIEKAKQNKMGQWRFPRKSLTLKKKNVFKVFYNVLVTDIGTRDR